MKKKSLAKQLNPKKFSLFLSGVVFAGFSIGALLWKEFIAHRFGFFIITFFLAIFSLVSLLTSIQAKKPITTLTYLIGISSLFILALFFGTQSTQLPFKIGILALAIAFMVPAVLEYVQLNKKLNVK